MRIGIIATIITTLFMASVVAPDAGAAPRLFDSSERRSKRLKPFPKWLDVLDRYQGEVTAESPCSNAKDCQIEEWNAFLNQLKGRSRLAQINAVNAYLNEKPYITDPQNWGVPDYWETPIEFHIRNGDCEDYAISKYLSLKKLGIDPRDMRVVVLMDNNLRVHHAILAVYQDDKVYILDNQIKEVVEHTSIAHYRPIYSINEKYWWRHR